MTQEFILACQRIESAKNYHPDITNNDLMSLVMNSDGSSKYTPRRKAIAIQNSFINPPSEQGKPSGKIYQVKISGKLWDSELDMSFWRIDDSMVILIDKNGKYSLHYREEAEKGNFTMPIAHLKVEDFLGDEESLSYIHFSYECLGLKLVENVKNELTKDFIATVFKEIEPPCEINEKNLSRFVYTLEKQKNSIAYLSAGFLLEGRITNVVDDEKNANYMEKRIHDAINFYIKAAEDPKIKPLVDYILWEIKTCSNIYPSVQKKLAEFDVTPGFVEHYALYQKKRDTIVAPLYQSLGLFSQTTAQKNNAIETVAVSDTKSYRL